MLRHRSGEETHAASCASPRVRAVRAAFGPLDPHQHLNHLHAAYAQGIWPGLFLTTTIAGLAFALREIPGVATFSPMILAIVIGMAFHNIVGTPRRAKDGVMFSLRRVLRFAITTSRLSVDGSADRRGRSARICNHRRDVAGDVRIYNLAWPHDGR